MADLHRCASVFTAASWANTDASLSHAKEVMESYVNAFPRADEIYALMALRVLFARTAPDSRVADTLRATIDRRIADQRPDASIVPETLAGYQ